MSGWGLLADDVAARELAARADPALAAPMAAYMRGRFPFHGVRSPDRTEVWRTVRDRATAQAGAPDHDEIVAFARAGWARPQREHQYLAAIALRSRWRLLGPADVPLLEELITSRSWWDSVDMLAPSVVGPLARRHLEVAAAMDRWIVAEDIWLARAAIIHQLKAKDDTDVEILARHCRLRAADTEFFVRKAIGWALRQYSAVDPDWVEQFVEATPLSPLSEREAMKTIRRTRAADQSPPRRSPEPPPTTMG